MPSEPRDERCMEIAMVLWSRGALAGGLEPPGPRKRRVAEPAEGLPWGDLTAALDWATQSPRALSLHLTHLSDDRLVLRVPPSGRSRGRGHARYFLNPKTSGSMSKTKEGSWVVADEVMARTVPQILALGLDALRFDRCARCGGRGLFRRRYESGLAEAWCLACHGTGQRPETGNNRMERVANLILSLCLGYDRFVLDAVQSMYCRRCGGHGGFQVRTGEHDEEHQEVCPACHGNGWNVTAAKAYQTFLERIRLPTAIAFSQLARIVVADHDVASNRDSDWPLRWDRQIVPEAIGSARIWLEEAPKLVDIKVAREKRQRDNLRVEAYYDEQRAESPTRR